MRSLFALLLLLPITSTADIIDDYENGSIFLSRAVLGSTTDYEGPGIPGVLGGYRAFTLDVTAIAAPVVSFAKAQVISAPLGFLFFSSDTGVNSSLLMTYDANAAGLNANLSSSVAFQLDVFSSDLPAPTSLTVYDNDSSDTVAGVIPQGLFSSVLFPFPSFPSIDFNQVQRIDLNIDPILSGDVALVGFTTVVPEASTVMGAFGLLALLCIRRLRQ